MTYKQRIGSCYWRMGWVVGCLGGVIALAVGVRSAQAQPPAAPAAIPPAVGQPAAQRQGAQRQGAQPQGAQPQADKEWVRIRANSQGQPLAMQTSVVRYRPIDNSAQTAGVEVDLIGAIHVGDAAYYQALNDRFKQYDALLYELVAPEGTVVRPDHGKTTQSPVGMLQDGMKSVLGLEHQLEKVDYTRPNFVHADMSPEDFLRSMKDRNEGFLQLYFKMLGQGIAHQSKLAAEGKSAEAEIWMALFSSDRPRKLKIAIAKQMCEMGPMLSSLGGEEGSTLITERNKIALSVMKKQIEQGKKRLGIFYGAGHLDDMDSRLREDFKMEPVSEQWLTAWDLR